MMKRIMLLLSLLSLFTFPIMGQARNEGVRIQEFNTALNSAYANYRAALFQTNKNNGELSIKTTKGFQQKWQKIITDYKDNPPAIYSTDSRWKATLQEINDIVMTGIEEIQSGHLSEAHETLESIRDILGALRARNGVIAYSDSINKYHEKMEELLLSHVSIDSLKNGELKTVGEKLAVLEFLGEELNQAAPQDYKSNSEFNKLLMANNQALKNLRQVVDAESYLEIIEKIKKLKPAYAILFLKFG